MDAAGKVIPTVYAGATLDCALMETVFHDLPFAAGPKMCSKTSHVAGKVYSQLTLSRDLALIDLSVISLHKLGISRKDLIECDGSQYAETRAWALALHDQHPDAESHLNLVPLILSKAIVLLKIALPVRRSWGAERRLHFFIVRRQRNS